jgi:hypothetical protein
MAGPRLLALLLLGPGAGGQGGDYYSDYPAYGDYDYPAARPPPALALRTPNSSLAVVCGPGAGELTHRGGPVGSLGGRAARAEGGWRVAGLQEGDWGVWACGGQEVALGMLPGTGGPHLLEGAGRLLPNGSVLRVTEGVRLDVACGLVPGAGPAPAWPPAWHWAGPEGPTEEPRGAAVSDLVSGLAPITVRREDEGARLACSLAGRTAWVTLAVEHPPEFTIGREPGFGTPVVAGSSLALLCSVEARPASLPVWERDGQLVADGWVPGQGGQRPHSQSCRSRLEFPVLEARHEGWYVCSTSHALGNFSSVGYYLSVQRPAGSTPAGGSTGRPSGLARVLVESGGSAPLCESDPRAPQLSAPAGPVRARAGEPARLRVTVCGVEGPGARVWWAGPGGALLAPGRGDAGAEALPLQGDCGEAALLLASAQPAQAGEWVLVARNRWIDHILPSSSPPRHGVREAVVELEVELEPGPRPVAAGAPGTACDILLLVLLAAAAA